MDVTNPPETAMLFVSFDSSYALSSHCLFCFSFYFFAGMVTWEESMPTFQEEWHEVLKDPGGGKNTHSVLEGLVPRPM